MRWTRRVVVLAIAAVAAIGVIPPSVPESPPADAAGLGAGGEYHPLTPTRIFDTRSGLNTPAGTVKTGVPFDAQVLGLGGVPNAPADVLAAVINVTVIAPNHSGFASIYPKDNKPAVDASLVNFDSNQNVPNVAIIGMGTDGKVTLEIFTANPAGEAHVAIDVFGWISTSNYVDTDDSGARFVPVGPARMLDTRNGTERVGPGESISLQVVGGTSINPVIPEIVPNDPNVTGVMVNITVPNGLSGSGNTFVSMTPTKTPDGQEPATSNTNVGKDETKANLGIAPVGPDGKVWFYNSVGETDIIVDVFGYLIKGEPDTSRRGRVIPLDSPFRAFDTRSPAFGNAPLGFASQENWSFLCFADSVTLNGVKLGNQTALIGNVTGTGLERIFPTQPVITFLSMYPAGGTRPDTSNINVLEGTSVPNMSMLRFGTFDEDGAGGNPPDDYVVQAFNNDGKLHYILDVYAVVLGDGPAPAPPAGSC